MQIPYCWRTLKSGGICLGVVGGNRILSRALWMCWPDLLVQHTTRKGAPAEIRPAGDHTYGRRVSSCLPPSWTGFSPEPEEKKSLSITAYEKSHLRHSPCGCAGQTVLVSWVAICPRKILELYQTNLSPLQPAAEAKQATEAATNLDLSKGR